MMSDLSISCIENTAAQRLKELWQSAFPSDPEDYIDGFFAHLLSDAVTMVGECDKKAVTMLFLLPADARFCGKSYPVRYLYAGCTHPAYRGRGYYRELMTAAAQTVARMGEHAIYLHPADDQLTATYQRLGYRTGICGSDRCQIMLDLPGCSSVGEYLARRRELVDRVSKNAVIWNPNEAVTRFFVTDAVARGAIMSADSARITLSFGETTVETLSADLSGEDDRYCLWLPIGDTPLSALMEKHAAFTGLVGD